MTVYEIINIKMWPQKEPPGFVNWLKKLAVHFNLFVVGNITQNRFSHDKACMPRMHDNDAKYMLFISSIEKCAYLCEFVVAETLMYILSNCYLYLCLVL